MAYEILKSIVEAEARAVEIKKQAVAQAEERKADALKQQEILLEEAKLQGAKEMHQAVENAVAESQEAIQKILKEAEEAWFSDQRAGSAKEGRSRSGGNRKGCGRIWQLLRCESLLSLV